MSIRQKIATLAAWLTVVAAGAESPQEAARKAMQASVARQMQGVAAMRMSVARQRASAITTVPAQVAATADVPAPYFTLPWPTLGGNCDPLPEVDLGPLVQQAAQKEGVDPILLRAVAEEESGFRACAVSPKGAMGLMQLMPSTAQELGVRDPFEPQENLQAGARFLKQLLARFGGDTALALGAYNAGPARVEESGGVPQIPETVRYVQQILSRLPIP